MISFRSPIDHAPHGLLHLMDQNGDESIKKICVYENTAGEWKIWLEWETEGYGNTLVRALNNYPIDPSEKHWILTHLRTLNRTLAQSLKTYRHPIQFTPPAHLIS